MKCPHCDYDSSLGDFDFYKLPIVLNSVGNSDQTRDLYGCPNCSKTFIY